MNEALQRWREDFIREPGQAFDRLVRGLVPLGSASQLSFGEILDNVFEPGEVALDAVATAWLKKHLLAPLPENTSVRRWASILEEYFRGIATMELPQTRRILRADYKSLRLWLRGFYEGPDRDPEGAYLVALAYSQDSQHFSPLWRRLILAEELAGRPYVSIGILGFRKMPAQNGHESAGVPDGLLQALMQLADKPGTGQTKWKQVMRSLFAVYRRSEGFWVKHLAPMLPHHQQASHARDWLTALLPGIRNWRPGHEERKLISLPVTRPVPVSVSRDWAQRIREDPSLSDTPAFSQFLDQHRRYVKATGDANFINKTFNYISTTLVRADRRRARLAVSLMEEALHWAPWDPRNWPSYAIVLSAAGRTRDAVDALWLARQRYPFDPFIRGELGRILRESGDLDASEGVLREATSHFPRDAVFRNGLVETLRAMGRIEEAHAVAKQAVTDFPDNVVCRNAFAETLRTMGRIEEAHAVHEQAVIDFPGDVVCRNALAETLRTMGQLEAARAVYEKACSDFPMNDVCRNGLGYLLLKLGEVEEAARRFRETLTLKRHDSYARNGLAEALKAQALRTGDKRLETEAKRLFRELAREQREDERRADQSRAAKAPSTANAAVNVAPESHGGAPVAPPAPQHPAETRPRPKPQAPPPGERIIEPPSHESATADKIFEIVASQGPEEPSLADELGEPVAQEAPEAVHGTPDFDVTPTIEPSMEPGNEIVGADIPRPAQSSPPPMSPAERLGRAMIALWRAERTADPTERGAFCAEAEGLLDVPETNIDADLLTGFVQTRGLVLLAGGDARRALTYFDEQIHRFGRGGWIGVRLGEQRARVLLGEPAAEGDFAETPSSQSARFALQVAQVIQALSRTPQESEVREVLKAIYPRAAEFAARTQTEGEDESEGKGKGYHIESGAEMLGVFMQTTWFDPAGIRAPEDLDQSDRLHALVERVNASRVDTFDVLFNAASELALVA